MAESLKLMCAELSVHADIFYEGNGMLSRLFGLFKKRLSYKKFHFLLRQKIYHFFSDRFLLLKLKKYDLIVVSDCIPNAYWRGYYDIEKLRKWVKKPVALYEVYYLGNSITHSHILKSQHHHGIERYDWNFSISEIAEIRNQPSEILRWGSIGLHIANCGLKAKRKDSINAIIDFPQEGFEQTRIEQIEILKLFPQINLIFLTGNYTFNEIRKIYQEASLFFVQFPEAFGVSIAECLSSGCQVVVKDPEWAMSWRLDDQEGKTFLPDCFFVYENPQNLRNYLQDFLHDYDAEKTPLKVNSSFMQHYPQFYLGDSKKLINSFNAIERLYRA